MATQNSALVRDNSTLTNFKQWAMAISAFFATAGWVQASDTGQVDWSTIASVPGGGSYVYEIWKSNDGLTTIYVKMEYGTASGTIPQMRVTVGTATNGAGVMTGFYTHDGAGNLLLMPYSANTVTSTVTQWQCYFSGDAGRMAIAMWVDDNTNNGFAIFTIQRSMNSSGVPTSAYVTLLGTGYSVTGPSNGACFQQTVIFGLGLSTCIGQAVFGSAYSRWLCLRNPAETSDNVLGNIPISPVFPDIGYFDNPMDIVQVGSWGDFTDQGSYVIAAGNMVYGVSHTYLAFKNTSGSGPTGAQSFVAGGFNSNVTPYAAACVLMRYD
jgi:hypothetical protein